MRKGAEYDRSLVECCIVRRDESDFVPAKAHGLATLLVRRGEHEREARVLGDQCA